MGGYCSKGAADAVVDPDGTPSTAVVDKGHNRSSSQPRRESEKRGMRQGLVHARPNASVWDNYEEVKVIGHGMTGKVYMVQHKATKEKYALKCMEMKKIDPELIQDLRNEIEVLKMQDHPNVIKLYEYYEDKDNLYLILEYADGGELFDRLHEQKGNRYTEAEAARLMFKMCAAIGYIHYMGVTHRDLKLENFIFESKTADSNIKLIDFGLSSKYGSSLRRMETMVGTPYYIAPEVLNQSDAASGMGSMYGGSNKGYTNACDCWSLGVIAYMLLSGTPPFKGRRDREVLQAVRRGKYTLSGPRWENISEDAKDFIRHLLVYNPAKRMTAEQSLKHPWLQKAKHETESRPLDPEILTTLRDFGRMTAFKRAAIEAIAFSMSAQSVSHLREAFTTCDKEQSGFVSLKEFATVMAAGGMGRDEASALFQQIDADDSGRISYTEFLAATLPRRFWLSKERIREAFSRLDVDNTGYITPDSLRKVMGDDWRQEIARQLFDEIGTQVANSHSSIKHSPGKVSVEELTDWFMSEFTTGHNVTSNPGVGGAAAAVLRTSPRLGPSGGMAGTGASSTAATTVTLPPTPASSAGGNNNGTGSTGGAVVATMRLGEGGPSAGSSASQSLATSAGHHSSAAVAPAPAPAPATLTSPGGGVTGSRAAGPPSSASSSSSSSAQQQQQQAFPAAVRGSEAGVERQRLLSIGNAYGSDHGSMMTATLISMSDHSNGHPDEQQHGNGGHDGGGGGGGDSAASFAANQPAAGNSSSNSSNGGLGSGVSRRLSRDRVAGVAAGGGGGANGRISPATVGQSQQPQHPPRAGSPQASQGFPSSSGANGVGRKASTGVAAISGGLGNAPISSTHGSSGGAGGGLVAVGRPG